MYLVTEYLYLSLVLKYSNAVFSASKTAQVLFYYSITLITLIYFRRHILQNILNHHIIFIDIPQLSYMRLLTFYYYRSILN